MAKKHEMPDLIFIGPIGSRERVRHKHCVFHVEAWDGKGRPRVLRRVRDDEAFDLRVPVPEGSPTKSHQFVTGYMHLGSIDLARKEET